MCEDISTVMLATKQNSASLCQYGLPLSLIQRYEAPFTCTKKVKNPEIHQSSSKCSDTEKKYSLPTVNVKFRIPSSAIYLSALSVILHKDKRCCNLFVL